MAFTKRPQSCLSSGLSPDWVRDRTATDGLGVWPLTTTHRSPHKKIPRRQAYLCDVTTRARLYDRTEIIEIIQQLWNFCVIYPFIAFFFFHLKEKPRVFLSFFFLDANVKSRLGRASADDRSKVYGGGGGGGEAYWCRYISIMKTDCRVCPPKGSLSIRTPPQQSVY